MAEAVDLVGKEAAEAAAELCLAAYPRAAARAEEQGIVICDTKFELGFIDGELSLCDEVLTPDSSRFWPADDWRRAPIRPSFDKQPLRDWLEAQPWDKQPPPPALPAEIVEATSTATWPPTSGSAAARWPTGTVPEHGRRPTVLGAGRGAPA